MKDNSKIKCCSFFISQSLSGADQFSVQYARNQVFVGARNKKNDILEVWFRIELLLFNW